ncbi:AMP-binding enzyme [Streptomyces lincolnensis]|uniref:AMP-binding enzyme n=1 Tax=Streptomyces lincolnensis TaxID=1915 RepID=UPI0035AB8AA1
MLRTHPRVRQAAVLGLSDPDWGKQVAAVINAAAPASPPTATELHDHLRAARTPHKTRATGSWPMPSRPAPRQRSRSSFCDGRSVTAA